MHRTSRRDDAIVTLNGHRIEAQTIEADAEKGWVLVMDCYRRYPARNLDVDVIVVSKNVVTRRLYGDVAIRLRGISVPHASAKGGY